MPDEGIEEPPKPSLDIPKPQGSTTDPNNPWNLLAHNKQVIKSWTELCRQIPENAKRCYEWLRTDPTRRIPGRCYELKHKGYAGAWGYEIGSGQRIYYRPRIERHDV